jgi:hypothetical protein
VVGWHRAEFKRYWTWIDDSGVTAPAVGVCVPLYARAPLDRSSGCLIEDRPEDSIGLPDVLDTPVAGDERKHLFGVFARHRGGLVGPHVRQVTQRDLERG